MAPPYFLLHFLLPLFTVVPFTRAASQISPPVSLPGCRNKCGNITVPYPFGFEPNCFREDSSQDFSLVCNESYNPPRLFISGDDREITDISPRGQLHILVTAKRACYNSSGDYISGTSASTYIAYGAGRPFVLSVSNNFYAVGCPNQGYFVDAVGYYVSGCVSACRPSQYSLGSTNGSCTGVGCCQSSIPSGLIYYEPYLQNFASSRNGIDPILFANHTNCSYVFLADSNWFQFDNSYLTRTNDFKVKVGMDWAVRNVGNCSYAKRNMTDFACRSLNHDCYNSDNGAGYLCNCSEGYQGNPYITEGCQDINECELKKEYPCYGDCTNTIGGFNCTCPRGTEGNATTKDGCRKKDNFTLALKIVTGASVGVFLVAFAGFWMYLGMQKRRLIRTRQQFFEQNGGVLLRQQMSSFKTTTFKIYTKEELEKATNKFSEDRVLGRGGHGIVYKGIFEDGTVAAIKRSKLMEEQETKEFAKEMLILAQINHKNVVKLLGCCLEVEVPMLVYEYISNGTLYHYIHKNNINAPIPLHERLRIAAESADALAYMHSSASPPILHGDVKTANILLDDNFVAKVSDFGASKLAPNDEAEIATLVQGTCGYLDPEYLLTCQLTDKSDVYSFAVIILELLTRKKALYFEGPEEDRSLASSFCVANKEGRFIEILDGQVRDEIKLEVLEEIGDLVMHCLNMNREERPTMREVADTLEKASKFQKKSSNEENHVEETESLLGDSVDIYTRDSSMSYSFAQQAIFDMESGRRRL
ncbi:Wall-associated receptor kinase 4 [Carex littledalei]|uniref:Wall-associated receptor kinase 4 n=1 Tax=Carex littledalei TaxID=544730 RepID=A0A833RUY3_9POAL|nr:Wall-associated receptor kinase 4 [Carex littledalei]